MKFADQLSIETPELVALEFPLAGIGSRFIAVTVDYCIQAAVFIALILGVLLFIPSMQRFDGRSAKWVIAIVILVPFLLQWGYFSLFERLWNGQTPGKRVARIRVIQQSGRAITMFESLARNLVRAVDFLPASYVAGVVCIFVTQRSQRLGDLVAGTLVVHELRGEEQTLVGNTRLFTGLPPQVTAPARPVTLPADALSRISVADLQAIETFLERRLDMALELRQSLATRLAAATAARMHLSLQEGKHPETFLEEVAYGARSLGKLR